MHSLTLSLSVFLSPLFFLFSFLSFFPLFSSFSPSGFLVSPSLSLSQEPQLEVPQPKRGRRRQLLFADQHTQISQSAMQEQISDPLVETVSMVRLKCTHTQYTYNLPYTCICTHTHIDTCIYTHSHTRTCTYPHKLTYSSIMHHFIHATTILNPAYGDLHHAMNYMHLTHTRLLNCY